jgi:hypothetical protein
MTRSLRFAVVLVAGLLLVMSPGGRAQHRRAPFPLRQPNQLALGRLLYQAACTRAMYQAAWNRATLTAAPPVLPTAPRAPVAGRGARWVATIALVRDQAGTVVGVAMWITTTNGWWVITMQDPILNVPVPLQLALIDVQFGLGPDRYAVGQVLQQVHRARQEVGG